MPLQTTPGDFYDVISHTKMVAFFLTLAIVLTIALVMSMKNFWKDSGAPGATIQTVKAALKDILTLRYLQSSGGGCAYPEEQQSDARRLFHHATFYGFLLCLASTTVAAAYHYLLNKTAPYPYMSLPVLLGTAGGLGLIAGTLGLGVLKLRQDERTRNDAQKGLDWEFLALLFLTSVTGLLLLFLRERDSMPALLQIHLGVVTALFLTMPYGKFVHGLYRSLALLRYSLESTSVTRQE